MTWSPISVTVAGHPVPLAATRLVAEPWKRAVADAVRRQWPGGYLEDPCALSLAFRLAPAWFNQTALVNLLKATIDGMASVVFKPAAGGHPGPFAREDWWITQLTTTKEIAGGAEGVRLTLTYATEPIVQTGAWLFDVRVPSPPPLWPGDKTGQAKVVAWQRQLCTLLQPQLVAAPAPPGTLSARLDFVVEPERFKTSDLDNFCVPAVQGIGLALFGQAARSDRIIRLAAAKKCARPDLPPGVRVRVGAF